VHSVAVDCVIMWFVSKIVCKIAKLKTCSQLSDPRACELVYDSEVAYK